jgi:MYXO-CTERM domain-containing protein
MRTRTRARTASRAVLAAVASAAALLAVPRGANAFCRTTTCPLPADFSPSSAGCVPPDFDSFCQMLNPPTNPLPVWWRNACVSYDIQKNASKQIAYDTAANVIAAAFAKWTGTSCGTDGTGTSRVSIDVRDFGPVDCDQVQYNSDQGNQHVIVFRDDDWPHDDPNNTLALTTVTFNPDTGEIYDADMEINSTIPLTVGDPVPPDGYDFESIVTHETGHFLGMAHSGDDHATMFAHYTQGSTVMRSLTSDDVGGICTIYPPDGTRAVDPSVATGGSIAEDACDPTPRHGFSSECASSSGSGGGSKGCDAAGTDDTGGALAAMGVLAAACAWRRRRTTTMRWT